MIFSGKRHLDLEEQWRTWLATGVHKFAVLFAPRKNGSLAGGGARMCQCGLLLPASETIQVRSCCLPSGSCWPDKVLLSQHLGSSFDSRYSVCLLSDMMPLFGHVWFLFPQHFFVTAGFHSEEALGQDLSDEEARRLLQELGEVLLQNRHVFQLTRLDV